MAATERIEKKIVLLIGHCKEVSNTRAVWKRTNKTARAGVVDPQHYEMTLVDPICYELFCQPCWPHFWTTRFTMANGP